MCPQPYSAIRKERALEINCDASRATATTTSCRGSYDLTRACGHRRARELTRGLTDEPSRPLGKYIIAIRINHTWESLEDEFPRGPGVRLGGDASGPYAAHLMLFVGRRTANLRGHFRLLYPDVLVVSGELVTAEGRHIHLDGPHVIVLASAA